MGATKVMVIRHAEKPDRYNGTQYAGVNNLGTVAGDDGTKHLVTLGWERAGALVTHGAWRPTASEKADTGLKSSRASDPPTTIIQQGSTATRASLQRMDAVGYRLQNRG